jgi:hypothetical protein
LSKNLYKIHNDIEWENAEQRALEIYNYRIKNYNPRKDGPPTFYMLKVQAEYDIESIPQYIRSDSKK